VNSLTFAKNGRSNIAFTEATVLKTTEAAASVASNVATALTFFILVTFLTFFNVFYFPYVF